ncbi:hypothetical protein RFI_32566 [Reticulomyxa filosa]|uniref:Uncharacterized protein n=1 Tax=Reticulomyxa filosa TaxID=46433 RepID=X6LVU7_RETFI|nr:hypothetical protein RFI_32566 [Reticulomyxa filosa]|eukprot:ETO04830.1 hypothetical protein RFI_32566 [Reticulomyxa filosa]
MSIKYVNLLTRSNIPQLLHPLNTSNCLLLFLTVYHLLFFFKNWGCTELFCFIIYLRTKKNAFVYLEKGVHKVTISFLRLKKLKEKMIKIINTTNNKTRNTTSHFKIVDNNGQNITSNEQLRIAFKEKPVFFFIQNHSWNKANKKAHEMVNEMINNKQQDFVLLQILNNWQNRIINYLKNIPLNDD